MKKKVKIAYIGGGSRAWARKLMSDLAINDEIYGEVCLYDIDFSAASDNVIIGNMIARSKTARSAWNYTAARTIEEALDNSDVVVISILPGTFEDMRSDVHTPEKFGVYQSVGDTAGFGGYLRAMRCAPTFMGFAEKIKACCPNALVINYTNPMTLCTRILIETFKEIKIIGCCHEVFGTQELLAKLVADAYGIDEPSREEIEIGVSGVNHFTWLTDAHYKGKDIFPIFAEAAKRYEKTGYAVSDAKANDGNVMFCKNIIKFEMFDRYGVIPAAGDRHLAEFFNGKWYLRSPEYARSKGFNLTSVDWRIADQKQKIEKTKAIVAGKESVTAEASKEEGVKQIKAFLGLGDLTTNVNIANKGQIKNYPLGAVVETNAKISDGKIEPVETKPLPPEINSFVLKHVYRHEAFINAMNRHDARAVEYIIADDPQCSSLTLDQVHVLFEEMFENTKYMLEPFWNK